MAEDKKKKQKIKRLGTAVEDELYDAFNEKAKELGRSSAGILRSFVRLWVEDEIGTPPKLPDEGRRVRKNIASKKED